MTKNQKALLIALALGDGYIGKPNSKSAQLQIGHSKKQEIYLEYKRDLLHSIVGGAKIKIHQKISNFNTEVVNFTKAHPYFRVIRKWLYRDGKKVITRKVLNKLTPQAIAIWYMDDGWLAIRKNPSTGNPRSRHIGLGTYGFTYDEHLIMQKYFKEIWGIEFLIIRYKDKFKMVLGANEGHKFINLISKYIIPFFKYKTDFKYATRARNTQDG